MSFHDGLADGEPQTDSPLLISVLIRSCKKIIKNLVQPFLRHPDPIVGYLKNKETSVHFGGYGNGGILSGVTDRIVD